MKEILVALAVLHGADATTTLMAFNRGAVEGNPFLPSNPAANLALKVGTAAGSMWLIHRLDASGHARLARILGTVSIGLESYAIGSNVRLTVRLGRKQRG